MPRGRVLVAVPCLVVAVSLSVERTFPFPNVAVIESDTVGRSPSARTARGPRDREPVRGRTPAEDPRRARSSARRRGNTTGRRPRTRPYAGSKNPARREDVARSWPRQLVRRRVRGFDLDDQSSVRVSALVESIGYFRTLRLERDSKRGRRGAGGDVRDDVIRAGFDGDEFDLRVVFVRGGDDAVEKPAVVYGR